MKTCTCVMTIALALLGFSTIAAQPHPDDIYWESGFETRQVACDEVYVSQGVQALAVYYGNLIVAGFFDIVDQTEYNNIASWDGVTLSTLGTGIGGSDARVLDLFVYQDMLYVGGSFITSAGGVPLHGIAVWNGSTWSDVGGSFPNEFDYVLTMIEYDGSLIVSGEFDSIAGIEVNHIAAWNGSEWSALGTGLNAGPYDLTVYDGKLIACGQVGMSYHGVVEWDGVSWQPTDFGQFNYPYVVTVYQGNLIAAGDFDEAGGVPVNNIAQYDGVSWSPLGNGVSHTVKELEAFGDELFVMGHFYHAGDDTARFIATWDGATWTAFELNIQGSNVNEAVEWAGGIVFAGEFHCIGGSGSNYVAIWDETRGWHAIETGMGLGATRYITQLEPYNGDLIASGYFMSIGGTPARYIASFDGIMWEALGSGIEKWAEDMIEWDGKLIVGGSYFKEAGGVPVKNVASWDGSTWDSLGSGLGNNVMALAEYDGLLIAAGSFTITYTYPQIRKIGKWDGTSWSALGDDYNAGMNSGITSLQVYDGLLYAAGGFTSASDVPVNRIAAWNGEVWSPLGTGVNDQVRDLTVWGDKLIVSGYFTDAGGVTVDGVAAWDGTNWSAVERPCDSERLIHDIVEFDGKLMACFDYHDFYPDSIPGIAQYDGVEWDSLGSGLSATDSYICTYPYDMCVHNNKLWVGGNFGKAGDKYSSCIAVWSKHDYVCGDADGSSAVDIDDVVYLIAFIFSGGPEPMPYESGDADCSGAVDIDDVVYLIAFIFSGGPEPCDPDNDGVPDC